MKNLKIDTKLLISVILVLIWIVLYIYVFQNYNEIFSKAAKVGEVFYNMCLSYIAGFIFYILTSSIPQREREKKFINKVEYHKTQIRNGFQLIIDELLKDTTLTFDLNNSSKENLREVLLVNLPSKLTNTSNYDLTKANIKQYLEAKRFMIETETQELANIIVAKGILSDEFYINLIELRKSQFVSVYPHFLRLKIVEQNMSIYTDLIWDSIEKMRTLLISN